MTICTRKVEEELPLKQGLKLVADRYYPSSKTVEEELPLKQGLKLSEERNEWNAHEG